jgi:16S rRNA processing protein RimM
VRTDDGVDLGPVVDVINLPGQDVLAINYQDREVLIPFVRAIVPDVDVNAKKIRVILPEGLLDE